MTDVRSPQRRGDSSEESRKERIDRELMELLNELRVALPGVQFLFAFLLVVPFQQQGVQLSDFQRDVYFAALLAAAVATGLLIAPAAQHRVLFRQHDKEALLRRSNRSAFLGLTVLALAIVGAVLRAGGWRVLRFWEHEDPDAVADAICAALGRPPSGP